MAFYKHPGVFFTDPYYKKLSSDAKCLYVYLNGRRELSLKNRMVDSENKPYIYCTRQEMIRVLGISESTVYRMMHQLRDAELLRIDKAASGKSPRLYITDLMSAANIKKTSAPTDQMDEWERSILMEMAGLSGVS